MTDSTLAKRLRGVFVALECSLCEGKRKVYPDERSTFPCDCPRCEGTGTEQSVMSLADFRVLLNGKP